MLGSSLAVGAVCCARHPLAFTLRAVLRELFTISVCVRFADRHFSVPTGFINRWPVFMLPSSRNCYATTGLEGSVCVWGLLPMPTTKGAPSSHASLTPLLRIHEHVPPMPSCAQVPFRVPSIPAIAATYRQHYRRYRQHYRCYRRRRRSDRCCRPPGRHCRLRHYRRSCAAGSCRQPPRLLCHFRPHPPSLPLLSSPFHRRHCRMLECRELLSCV